jgi:hypothetical protein
MRFRFKLNILKNYTQQQLNQLSRAGGNEDASSSTQHNPAPITSSGIFTMLLRSADAGTTSTAPSDQDSDMDTPVTITDLDNLTNNENQLYPEPPVDEDSRGSAVDFQLRNRPETADHGDVQPGRNKPEYQFQPESPLRDEQRSTNDADIAHPESLFVEKESDVDQPALDSAGKQGITNKLCPFMPADRKEFLHQL